MSRFSAWRCADGIARRRRTLGIRRNPRNLPPRCCAWFDQFQRRRRQCRLGFGLGWAGDFDQRLQQPGDPGQALLFVIPVAQINDFLVGADL